MVCLIAETSGYLQKSSKGGRAACLLARKMSVEATLRTRLDSPIDPMTLTFESHAEC